MPEGSELPPGQGQEGKFDKLTTRLSRLAEMSNVDNHTRGGNEDTALVDLHIAVEDQELLRQALAEIGFVETGAFGAVVSGFLPVPELHRLEYFDDLVSASLSSYASHAHGVISQGDRAHQADLARDQFGVDGQGVRVGVLSDSLDSGAAVGSSREDIEAGELPQATTIVADSSFGEDEGRAMAQIVHDIAPGAEIVFHTASLGEASFARAISDLAERGVDVVVDDVLYFREPMFMDGIVAQAVTEAEGRGVTYISAAGNLADQAYFSEFRPVSRSIELDGLSYDRLHDFDPGPGRDTTQPVKLLRGETMLISFQWDEPFFSATNGRAGSRSDLDIYLLDKQGRVVASSVDDNIGDDAVEVLEFVNDTKSEFFDLVIGHFDGPAPNLIKYVEFDGQAEFRKFTTDSGSVYGHPAANEAISVGAAFYQETPAFGTDPAILRDFSSNGAVSPILFDNDGKRLDTPELRQFVDLVGPDGVDTTFFGLDDLDDNGLPNFSGTSAAAPHIAGIVALMLDRNPDLLPEDVLGMLSISGLDMDDPFTSGFDIGPDASTGVGLIDAVLAVDATDTVSRRTIAEFGRIEAVTSELRTIELENEFVDPIIIAGPPSRAGSDPGTVRISSIHSGRFDIRFDEPSYRDDQHTTESLSYLVVEAGRWVLPDGTVIEAGTLLSDSLAETGFDRIEFSQAFGETPIVLSQIQTENDADYAVVRMQDSDAGGFSIAMQEEEANFFSTKQEETLGYLAIEKGVHAFRGIDFQAGVQDGIGSVGGALRFDDVFDGDDPLLFASISSFRGSDTSTLRVERIDDDRARIAVEEERSFDSEVFHIKESIDFVAFDGPGRIVIEDDEILSA